MKIILPYLTLAPHTSWLQEFSDNSSKIEDILIILGSNHEDPFLNPSSKIPFTVKKVSKDSSYHEAICQALENLKSSLSPTDRLCILPPSFVIDDKTLDYAESLLDYDCSLVFMDEDDNVVHRIEDKSTLSLGDYTLYAAYDKEPIREDYKTLLCGTYQSLCELYNPDVTLKFKAHYLYKYFFKELIAKKKCTAHIVNNRFFLDESLNLPFESAYEEDLAFARTLQGFFKKPPEFAGLRRLLGFTYADNHLYASLFFKTLKVRIKREPRFPVNAISQKKVHEVLDFPKKRAAIVAGFTKDGEVSENTLDYLLKIKENTDYVVFVADSLATPSTLEKLSRYTDALVIERHREYDFGSYKRGFEVLLNNGVLDKVEELLLCNDSIDFVGESADLDRIFNQAQDYDAYGLCYATYGFGERLKRHHYAWVKMPHLQSYFVILQKKAFLSPAFIEFMHNIRRLKNKREIIKQYEMGFTAMLKAEGFTLGSYYPFDENNVVNPYVIYLNGHQKRPLFIKHMLAHTSYVSE